MRNDKVLRNSLIFIGEMSNKNEMTIKNKPGFYDALVLSKQSAHSTKSQSYQSIPCDKLEKISIRIFYKNIQFTYRNQSLQLIDDDEKLTEEEVINVFNNFAVKEGDKITYLVHYPSDKIRSRKKKKARILAEEKKLNR
ncbi:hypothetical protein [Neobacillus ginsengisoli]|uniref:Uncharacterized protein n=1 Tax=Neobacillus ginsengisoli TaxID=904295 RepID=A0ABT9XZX4_9BACI|nr:hypothetical protein [Neobacillus ginsengisoli]MDQ0200805.1 hypothetical protein [Neobacillus ginsengisoli]